MNTLHTLIEAIDDGRCDGISRPLSTERKSSLRALSDDAPNLICYDMGEMDKLLDFDAVTELFRLPYPKCWFETWDPPTGDRYGFIAHESPSENPDGVMVITFLRQRYGWHFVGVSQVLYEQPDEEKISVTNFDFDPEMPPDSALPYLACFLSALHGRNGKPVSKEPDQALQKARARRGKKPMFSFYTLEIELSTRIEVRMAKGGTHASPKEHTRASHQRTYKSGLKIMVKSTTVGSARNGIVFKDYAVAKLPTAQNKIEALAAAADARMEEVVRETNGTCEALGKVIVDLCSLHILGTLDEPR